VELEEELARQSNAVLNANEYIVLPSKINNKVANLRKFKYTNFITLILKNMIKHSI
jgi:hypothetical protein